MDKRHTHTEIQRLKQRLRVVEQVREKLIQQLQALESHSTQATEVTPSLHQQQALSSQEKIALFRRLFCGRADVYAKRWQNHKTGRSGYSPACRNEWVSGICDKPNVKCGQCTHQAFLPVTDQVIHAHLTGKDKNTIGASTQETTIGVYPLLPDDTCWFLAVDFDKANWQEDISAFIKTCQTQQVPAYVERSRSGNGGHVWIFFNQPIAANDARKLGAYLLTKTMAHHPDMGFSSYDRLFPNQDTLPIGGFGNLIALPLQHKPRQAGNSVFVDEQFNPYSDQWARLVSIIHMTADQISAIMQHTAQDGDITGLHMPIENEDVHHPWKRSPSRKPTALKLTQSLPDRTQIVLGNQLYIAKGGLSAALINRLIRIAAFQNPEFYKAQAMRFSTFNKPRIIACAENLPRHIGLPRGCLDDVIDLLNGVGVKIKWLDERQSGQPINTQFTGVLRQDQQPAITALLSHDTGVLSATTGFGKTVLAANIIAHRGCNTLILVHRKQLLEQWIARLSNFLSTEHIKIGQIGGGKRQAYGKIDIALIQSLVRHTKVDDIVANYGQLIVDECHHLSAVSFEAVARQCTAKYVIGLTATPIRKDGQHPIIFMQCGPIRYHLDTKSQTAQHEFTHYMVPRYSSFRLPENTPESPSIQAIYAALINNHQRNEMIAQDILAALQAKRSPLVLTERKNHITWLVERLSGHVKHLIVLYGGMGKRAHQTMLAKLESISDDEERLIIATGRYIGEGFDDARLDTLFLAMPISWKGTLTQYAGRLHRNHHHKTDVQIYDYIDKHVPVLQRMSEKRIRGYKNLGYQIVSGDDDLQPDLLSAKPHSKP